MYDPSKAVTIQWTGVLDWTTGLDYWIRGNCLWRRTYSRLQDLLAPKKPQDKSLRIPVLFQELKELCKPQLLANHRKKIHFHRRNQVANQSVAKCIAELQRLATNCDFGEYLNDALRDYLVCGLRNTGIQKQLLSEENPR